MEKQNNFLHYISFALIIIGGLNWLLIGVFDWDIGSIFGGQDALISRIIYILVGLAAVYEVATHKSRCKACGTEAMSEMKSDMSQSSPT